MSKEIIHRMINHYSNVTKSVYLGIDKHTIQIFYESDRGKEAYGTAILIKHKKHHFILSAAHVFEMDEIQNLYFEIEIQKNGNTAFKKIGEYILLASQKVNEKRKNDKVDIAVLKLLAEDDIKLLESNFKFYNFEEADKEHSPIPDIPYYIVFGYPGKYTKFKNKYRKENKRKVFVFNSQTKEFPNCEKFGFDTELNIFIDYPKKLQKEGNNQLIKPPNPRGISGCGLWRITDSINIQSKNWHYNLVGIMIEVHNERILVGTKLKYIEAIVKYLNNEKST